MTTTPDRVWQAAQADKAAQAEFPTEDVSSPMATCPARQAEVFIVPTRYAMAEQAAEHKCFKPACEAQSHAMALRRLRTGYLYLWHHEGPLKRYAVAADGLLVEQGLDDGNTPLETGSLAGFALNKQHDAWLAYTEAPLTAAFHQRLSESKAERKANMQRISLTQIAKTLEAKHCLPLDKAEELIGELMPKARDRVLASDHANNGDAYRQSVETLGQEMMRNPTKESVKNYVQARTWLFAREQAAGLFPPDSKEATPDDWSTVAWDVPATEAWLNTAKSQAGALYAVFAALDDDLGVLRDLNYEQAWVSQRAEEWDKQNAHKGMIAGFINSLINEDGAELSSLLNYRYRDRDIQLTPDQGETLLQAKHELKKLLDEETDINQNQRHKIGHTAADARIAEVHQREQVVLAPTKAIIPADLHSELQDVVMAYQADKTKNMTDAKSGAQVRERVRLADMQEWIDQVAEPHNKWLQARRDLNHKDMTAFLPRHGKALWYADYNESAHCKWLSELTLNTLSELCSTGPGTQLAINLLRAPSPEQPFSLLSSGFSMELVDIGDRANDIEGALTSANQAAIGQFVGSLVTAGKFTWLSGLGGESGSDWGLAVSRLSAAYSALQAEHLTDAAKAPANLIMRFPDPLRSLLIITRLTTDTVVNISKAGFSLTGSAGQTLWNWSKQAGQQLQKGLTPAVTSIRSMDTLGGVLPLAALLLHISNAADLSQRDTGREDDNVRDYEHTAANLKVAAALTAVIGAAWEATGQVELGRRGFKAPIVTSFGFITGSLAAVASIADLSKLSAEMQKEGTYWDADHWARLGHDSAILGLTVAQASFGGFSTYMALTNKWTTEQAIKWFTLRMVPVNWLLLIVEGLYLAWQYFKDSELQTFLEQCCWGQERRWNDSPSGQSQELQTLINLLFKPQVQADGSLSSRQLGSSGNTHIVETRTEHLKLYLPGADPDRTQLYLRVVAFDKNNFPTNCTTQWLANTTSEWLPIHQGMGLCLSGALPRRSDVSYWHLHVIYHCPLAMQTGTLSPQQLVVGGAKGMRYIIKGSSVVEHRSTDGPLRSDDIKSVEVPRRLLTPKDDQ